MNDNDIDNENEIGTGLHDYYESIAPADSVRATRLVVASIAARRERSAIGGRSTRIWALMGIAAALTVALGAGVGLATWRLSPNGGLPTAAPQSPAASTPASGPTASASETRTTRPSPTLRAATKSTPSHKFSPTGSMGGNYETATLLLDGRVLMTGASTRQTIDNYGVPLYSTSAEVYDPGTGKFSQTGSMVQAQGGGTTTLLQDGRVLIAGGVSFSDDAGQLVATKHATAELYDPATGQFSLTGSMTEVRADQTATLLQDGDVLMAGGDNLLGPIATAELYDPKSGTFRPTGALATARSLGKSTLLNDGRVFIYGGFGVQFLLTTAELYDPKTGEFTSTGWLGTNNNSDTVTPLLDGRLLVAGGNDGRTLATAQLYDPKTGQFTPTGSMTTAREAHMATLLSDGKVLIAGGVLQANMGYVDPGRQAPLLTDGASFVLDRYDSQRSVPSVDPGGLGMTGSSTTLKSAELYDPKTGKFTATGSMTSARALSAATLLLDGRVLFAGGDSAAGTSAELYQP